MQDIFLYLGGVLGLIVSVIHGYLGEVKVIRPTHSPSIPAKRVLSAIMFLSAVYWGAASLLLLVVPTQIPEASREIVCYGVAAIYVSGSLGNLWATRGKHPGWVLLAAATILTLAGS